VLEAKRAYSQFNEKRTQSTHNIVKVLKTPSFHQGNFSREVVGDNPQGQKYRFRSVHFRAGSVLSGMPSINANRGPRNRDIKAENKDG
jgi:hypothetical protein